MLPARRAVANDEVPLAARVAYDRDMSEYGRGGRPIADENEFRVLRERPRDMAAEAERGRIARRVVGPGWWARMRARLRRAHSRTR